MAKKGIEYVVFGKWQEDGSYTDGKFLSETAALNGAMTKASGKDFGDNRLLDNDNSITGGNLTWEANRDEDPMYEYLLGHKATEEDGEESGIIHNANDVAPYVGVGAVGQSGDKYRAKFYHKVKFSEPNDDNATKQESTTFGHVTLEGEIFVLPNGDFKEQHTFADLDSAKAWLDKKVGITKEPGGETV